MEISLGLIPTTQKFMSDILKVRCIFFDVSDAVIRTRALLQLEIGEIQLSIAQVKAALNRIEDAKINYEDRMCLLTMYWIATNAKRHALNLNLICQSFNEYVGVRRCSEIDPIFNTLQRIVNSVLAVVKDELSVDQWDTITPFLHAQVQISDENDLEMIAAYVQKQLAAITAITNSPPIDKKRLFNQICNEACGRYAVFYGVLKTHKQTLDALNIPFRWHPQF